MVIKTQTHHLDAANKHAFNGYSYHHCCIEILCSLNVVVGTCILFVQKICFPCIGFFFFFAFASEFPCCMEG